MATTPATASAADSTANRAVVPPRRRNTGTQWERPVFSILHGRRRPPVASHGRCGEAGRPAHVSSQMARQIVERRPRSLNLVRSGLRGGALSTGPWRQSVCGRRVRRRTARNEVAKKSAATARRATQFNDARQTTSGRGATPGIATLFSARVVAHVRRVSSRTPLSAVARSKGPPGRLSTCPSLTSSSSFPTSCEAGGQTRVSRVCALYGLY